MPVFATYLHPESFETSRPRDEISFVGQSLPYFDGVRQALVEALPGYPSVPPARCALGDFERVHDPDYLRSLRRLADGDPETAEPRRSAECSGLEFALPGCEYTLGGMMEIIRRMREGSLSRGYVFGAPGHHAYPDWGHGYCLLNPQAAAARYAQELGFGHPLIIDWDFHHGDGTQAIFAGDRSVHCISIHSAIDLYMSMMRVTEHGTSEVDERGLRGAHPEGLPVRRAPRYSHPFNPWRRIQAAGGGGGCRVSHRSAFRRARRVKSCEGTSSGHGWRSDACPARSQSNSSSPSM